MFKNNIASLKLPLNIALNTSDRAARNCRKSFYENVVMHYHFVGVEVLLFCGENNVTTGFKTVFNWISRNHYGKNGKKKR